VSVPSAGRLDHVGPDVADLGARSAGYAAVPGLDTEFTFEVPEAGLRGAMPHSPHGHRIELVHRAGDRSVRAR
jgi:hypothetical protein